MRALKRLFVVAFVLTVALVVTLVLNALRQGSRQLDLPPAPALAVDRAAAAASLSQAVQARTVSGLLDPAGTAAAFEQLHAHLRARYPLVHQRLEREVVGTHGLLFTWRGSDASAKPIALLAHQDVVPVAPGTEGLWQQPPFSGHVDERFVWGRGTWDDKGNLIAQLEAVEMLLAAGHQPRRTVYLAYGHDEEVGGREGAVAIATLLKDRGVRLDFVLDEGLLITDGVMPGLAPPAALIGVAEKGYLSLRLSTDGTPGHSSMPPPPGDGAIGILARALHRLETNPVPGGIQGVARQMFEAIAPEMAFTNRVVLSNMWLLRPVVERMLARQPSTNAMMRTTTALTIVQAGNKDNVLHGRAEATVNFRLLPGDSVDGTMAFVRRAIADERVKVEPLPGHAEPSAVAPLDGSAYQLVERTVRELFPGVIVAPGLMIAATDARHYEPVADQVLRFSPVRATSEDLKRFHGTDERLAVDNLAELIRFYHRLVEQATK